MKDDKMFEINGSAVNDLLKDCKQAFITMQEEEVFTPEFAYETMKGLLLKNLNAL